MAPPSSCLNFHPAAVALQLASPPHADHHCSQHHPRISAARATGRHTKRRGDHVMRENLLVL